MLPKAGYQIALRLLSLTYLWAHIVSDCILFIKYIYLYMYIHIFTVRFRCVFLMANDVYQLVAWLIYMPTFIINDQQVNWNDPQHFQAARATGSFNIDNVSLTTVAPPPSKTWHLPVPPNYQLQQLLGWS